jgi:hypothetical protein
MKRARRVSGLVLPAALLAIGAVASCKPDPKGALVLAIDSDHAPGIDFDRFQIQISSSNSKDKYDNLVVELGRPGLLTFPTTLSIVTNDDPSTSVHIRVITGKASGGNETQVGKPRTLREVVANVPTNRVALLHLTLDWLCVGGAKAEPDRYVEALCAEGLTCIAGACVDWSIDSASLPEFSEEAVFGGGSRRGDGECFDTTACFAAGEMSDVRMDDCSVALPSGIGVNVALVLVPSEGGICADPAKGPCLVPLTQGAREGYRIVGDRAVLPRAACDRLAEAADARKVVGVATTGACVTKTQRLPTCGDWSPYRKPLGPAGAPAGYTTPPPRDAGADAR